MLGVRVGVPEEFADWFADLADDAEQPHVGQLSGQATGSDPLAVLTSATLLAVEHSELLCMHAGVVAGQNGLVVLPGVSGLGKTTLVAALVQSGFGYVSDEALAIDRAKLGVESFARPLALSAASCDLLGLDFSATDSAGAEMLVRPSELGRISSIRASDVPATNVNEIVLAQRGPGATSLRPGRRGEAVVELLTRSFNSFRQPTDSFHAIVETVRNARVWRACYSDARELAELMRARF